MLTLIAEQLNIAKGLKESNESWIFRVVYSAIGHITLTSLFDVREDNEPNTVDSFKHRIRDLYESYQTIFPEIKVSCLMEPRLFANTVYELLKATGHFYHSPHRLSPTPLRSASSYKTTFLRGGNPAVNCFRSGLGAYSMDEKTGSSQSLADIFGLPSEPLTESWNKECGMAHWTVPSNFDNAEFLCMKPPIKSYFSNRQEKNGHVSLARTGEPGQQIYYLYRYKGREIDTMQLPSWKVLSGKYRTLSNMCLRYEDVLPPTEYQIDGEVVYLTVRYLYPPSIQNFLSLYSWPSVLEDSFSSFRFTIATPVFNAIKKELEKIEYQFAEV